MELKIDSEFESKIPPLTSEEFRQLEENILAAGVYTHGDFRLRKPSP